ncbi:MAG: hypothetical protein NTW49_08150 [Bacteroidia bacterium]|nr:hypothetical protein [Bacteroidia bacterium]
MKRSWFKRTGIFYIPASLAGWIILFTGVVCAIYSFIDIDSSSHSVSDTLINFVYHLLIIVAVYSSIAFLSDRNT